MVLLLYFFSTPQSGRQFRATLVTNADCTKDKLHDIKLQASNVKQSVNMLTNEAKNNIPQIINELKQSITTFSQEIEPSKNNLQQEIESLQNSISEIEKNIAQFTDKKKKTARNRVGLKFVIGDKKNYFTTKIYDYIIIFLTTFQFFNFSNFKLFFLYCYNIFKMLKKAVGDGFVRGIIHSKRSDAL